MRVLERLQHGLERLYRIDTRLAIHDFVIDDQARRSLGVQRAPREQLLVSQSEGDLELAVFVDDSVIANLSRHDPGEALHEANFGDFLLALEGVSHFVYVAWCAHGQRQVSALELELQAEIDKYATCLLMLGAEPERSDVLRHRLYREFSFEDDLGEDERAPLQRLAGAPLHPRRAHRRHVARAPALLPHVASGQARLHCQRRLRRLEASARGDQGSRGLGQGRGRLGARARGG
jgi:hypothetical protein